MSPRNQYQQQERAPRALSFLFCRLPAPSGLLAAVCLLALAAAGHAQETAPPAQQMKKLTAEEIFLDIMQTLPADSKDKVKSAGGKTKSEDGVQALPESVKQNIEEQRRQALMDLPEDIRKKVEAAMKQMENQQDERKLQLKEVSK